MRRVVLIAGPPGAGKSTLANTYGLPVLDLDEWPGPPASFRAALRRLRFDPDAAAVVIRCNPTPEAIAECGATELVVIRTPLAECSRRIRARGRKTPPIGAQIAAAQEWWRTWADREPTLTPRRRSL